MKKKMIKYRSILFLSICVSFLLSCNDEPKTAETGKENSFFGSIFEGDASQGLNVTSGEISSALEESPVQLLNGQEVSNFYEKRSNTAAWNDAEVRTAFYEELKEARQEGLQFGDYHGQQLQNMMENPAALSTEEQAHLEIILTDAFFEYASHLLYGKLDPNEMYDLWGVKRQDKNLAEILNRALEQGEIAETLANLKPSHQVYSGLRKSLQEYRELKNKEQVSITKIEEGPMIKAGKKDERISSVIQRLKELEVLKRGYTSQDSTYDKNLQKAVEEFQKKKGLQVDGILGNSTIRELNMTPEDRYDQILANLERWRWYPRDLGEHYILINIPAFELAVVKDGDTIRQHDVIAGAKARPTPVFSDTLQYIVINPEWTIPPTIKSQDIIPAASSNPSYLRNNNIKVYSDEGERVDPSRINWNSEGVMNYTFVQRSGPSNPLGRVKIIYPNDYLIYLHDTPAKALFQQNFRAESSGCVRVEKALDLAAYVVKDRKWDLEQIKETIESGKTTQVKIESPIQVHHFYWTAWRDNGKTMFTEDVYELDREIYTALREN